ncbi:hypothetical protein ACFY97_01775 [Streptomyces klenkii]|uniref:hypothetical protein n=1 Tax=Streptomyces klenkii TaxID=1420899 RepID=UPI0036E32380
MTTRHAGKKSREPACRTWVRLAAQWLVGPASAVAQMLTEALPPWAVIALALVASLAAGVRRGDMPPAPHAPPPFASARLRRRRPVRRPPNRVVGLPPRRPPAAGRSRGRCNARCHGRR